MYSYEDRLRAVELYIKLGKRVRLAIRQLGYPTKNALKGWYQAYARDAAMPAGYAPQPRYSQAQRDLEVEHYQTYGRCLAATTRAFGYPSRPLLSAWIQGRDSAAVVRVVGRSPEASPAAKQSAVIAICMRKGSAQSVADEVGVSRPTLYKWRHQLIGHDTTALKPRRQNSPPNSDRDSLEKQVDALRRNIRRLQLEQNLLKKANELLKKIGVDQRLLTNREKTELVDALRSTYTLNELIAAVGPPRSSFFYHLARLDTSDKYEEVRGAIVDIFDRNYRCYGYRRLHASLSDRSLRISEKVVRRLMKQEALVASGRRRRRYGSYIGEIRPAPDNLLNRDFSAESPNEKWLTDIAELQIPAGKVYLSPVIDC